MRELWNTDRVERSLTVLEKFQIALTCAIRRPCLGTEPGQSVGGLIRLRNDVVHVKPKMQWTDELHKLEELLRPRIGENRCLMPLPGFRFTFSLRAAHSGRTKRRVRSANSGGARWA